MIMFSSNISVWASCGLQMICNYVPAPPLKRKIIPRLNLVDNPWSRSQNDYGCV